MRKDLQQQMKDVNAALDDFTAAVMGNRVVAKAVTYFNRLACFLLIKKKAL